jgi:hypothetical protein
LTVAALCRLQVVASGTDVPMWEIQHRYEALFVAIQKSNWEMGVYHLEKLRDRMNAVGMKRPARTQNIEGMFLKSGVWPRTWAFSTTARRSCAPKHFRRWPRRSSGGGADAPAPCINARRAATPRCRA